MARSERKKLEASSWFAVVRAYQECTRRYAQLLHGFELTITQFDVMNAVDKLGAEAVPKAIADELVVTRGNISGVLQRLQQSGLLETRTHAVDGRSFVCELTAGGRRLLQQARLAAGLFIDQQLAPFSDDELQNTENTMKRMRLHLQTIHPDTIADRVLAQKPLKGGRETAA